MVPFTVDMDSRTCVICREPVDLAGSIAHKCSHRTHGLCLKNLCSEQNTKPDFHKCPHCLGLVDVNEPLLPESEPDNFQGRDYVVNPLEKPPAFSKLKKLTRNWTRVDKDETEDLVYLLSLGPQECPMDWLMRNKEQMGLQRLLAEGIQIDDLLDAGYTWKDLCMFKDVRGGGDRCKKALVALGMDAAHFRDHPTALPFAEIKEKAGITGRDVVELFGLYFPDGAHLTQDFGVKVAGREKTDRRGWLASDLVNLQLTADDLWGAGIEWLEQYEQLQANDEEETKLLGNPAKVDAFLASLPSLEEEWDKQAQAREEEEVVYVPRLKGYQPKVIPVESAYVEPVREVVIMQPKITQARKGFGHGIKKSRRRK